MMDYNVYTFIFLIPCAAKMTFDVLLGWFIILGYLVKDIPKK
jgi:hypothetical protein